MGPEKNNLNTLNVKLFNLFILKKQKHDYTIFNKQNK